MFLIQYTMLSISKECYTRLATVCRKIEKNINLVLFY